MMKMNFNQSSPKSGLFAMVCVSMKYLVLENIRSAYNVGAMFRTADGAGVDKIFLVGYTPTPIDRFARVQPEIKKTSLGASESVPWEHFAEPEPLVQYLQSLPCAIVAVEQTKDSRLIQNFTVPENVAYIMGNEVAGVSREFCAAADTIIEIPMLGEKESLNVSVAAGVVLYHGLYR
jgi:tRNA G18 (ribose-2'-O)-methylase SpoU